MSFIIPVLLLLCFGITMFWTFRAIAAIEDGLDDVRRIRIAAEIIAEHRKVKP